MHKVIFYNNEGIKLDLIVVHMLMQMQMNWNMYKLIKAGRFPIAIVISRGLLLLTLFSVHV